MSAAGLILRPSDPRPGEWVSEDSTAPVLLLCEHAGQSVASVGDGVEIAANVRVTSAELAARRRGIFDRPDRAIGDGFAWHPRRAAFSIHSFPPHMNGHDRAWHAGFFARADAVTAQALITYVAGAKRPETGAQRTLRDRGRDRLVHPAPRRTPRPRPQPDRSPQRPAARRCGRDALGRPPVGRDRLDPGACLITLTRNISLDPAQSAFLFVDVQNCSAHPNGAKFAGLSEADYAENIRLVFFEPDARVSSNMQRIQRTARAASVEVLYTTIEILTLDGRDRSLDDTIAGFHVPKGPWDGKVIDRIAPEGDEVVQPKSSWSVSISTHFDDVLRYLGVRHLVISGLVTAQYAEGAIRDACDLGYLVTRVTGAGLTCTPERHEGSLRTTKGYCRQVTTEDLVAELSGT